MPPVFRGVLVFFFLYLFLVGIAFLEVGIGALGEGFQAGILESVAHPLAGLCAGVLATVLVQSSSVTTATIVGMVGAGTLPLGLAVPMVMGANIGTTITNTLASLGTIRRSDEVQRAFAAATVHDFFNILAVLVLFPLEVTTGALSGLAVSLSDLIAGARIVPGTIGGSPIRSAVRLPIDFFAPLFGMGTIPGILMLTLGLGLIFASLVAGCSSTPRQLSDLPTATDAPIEDILRRAERRDGAEANLLRLHAAQTAWDRNQANQVRSILAMIPQSDLPLDQQQRFSELQARSELALGQPAAALRALRHPSLEQFDTLAPQRQLEIQLLRAETMAASGEYLNAAQERMFIHNLLPESERPQNLAAIWEALNQTPTEQLREASASASGETAGWLSLALIQRDYGNLDLQVHALQQWQAQYPNHPAVSSPPEAISRLLELHAQRPEHLALLLPFEGNLAGAADALRDGFLAAQYNALGQGLQQPQISMYDSGNYTDLMQFYQQAVADGVQWVVGPLDRQQVMRLATLPQLPLPLSMRSWVLVTSRPLPAGVVQLKSAPGCWVICWLFPPCAPRFVPDIVASPNGP